MVHRATVWVTKKGRIMVCVVGVQVEMFRSSETKNRTINSLQLCTNRMNSARTAFSARMCYLLNKQGHAHCSDRKNVACTWLAAGARSSAENKCGDRAITCRDRPNYHERQACRPREDERSKRRIPKSGLLMKVHIVGDVGDTTTEIRQALQAPFTALRNPSWESRLPGGRFSMATRAGG